MSNKIAEHFGVDEQDWVKMPISERALLRAAYACDVLKVRETGGENRGPEVDRYLKTAKAPLGSPWCGAFVTTNFLDSGWDAHDMPKSPASTLSWTRWAKTAGRVVPQPSRGDVFVIRHTATTGHMGHVAEWFDDGSFRTIEGNTNDDGSREGYEVARRRRQVTPKTTFISMK